MEDTALLLLLGALMVVASTILGEKCHTWWMTESGIAILVGMFVGLCWYLWSMGEAHADDFSAQESAQR